MNLLRRPRKSAGAEENWADALIDLTLEEKGRTPTAARPIPEMTVIDHAT